MMFLFKCDVAMCKVIWKEPPNQDKRSSLHKSNIKIKVSIKAYSTNEILDFNGNGMVYLYFNVHFKACILKSTVAKSKIGSFGQMKALE